MPVGDLKTGRANTISRQAAVHVAHVRQAASARIGLSDMFLIGFISAPSVARPDALANEIMTPPGTAAPSASGCRIFPQQIAPPPVF